MPVCWIPFWSWSFHDCVNGTTSVAVANCCSQTTVAVKLMMVWWLTTWWWWWQWQFLSGCAVDDKLHCFCDFLAILFSFLSFPVCEPEIPNRIVSWMQGYIRLKWMCQILWMTHVLVQIHLLKYNDLMPEYNFNARIEFLTQVASTGFQVPSKIFLTRGCRELTRRP